MPRHRIEVVAHPNSHSELVVSAKDRHNVHCNDNNTTGSNSVLHNRARHGRNEHTTKSPPECVGPHAETTGHIGHIIDETASHHPDAHPVAACETVVQRRPITIVARISGRINSSSVLVCTGFNNASNSAQSGGVRAAVKCKCTCISSSECNFLLFRFVSVFCFCSNDFSAERNKNLCTVCVVWW